MEQDAAETLALQALAWLAGNEELLPVFLGASGAGADDLRQRAGDPEFLVSVLDFILLDEAWVIAFCESIHIKPDLPMIARQALPGGGDVHWT